MTVSAKERGRGIGAETKGSAWPFVALALPILWSMTPPLSTPFLDIITIPISIYRGGDGDDRFCGGSHVRQIWNTRHLDPQEHPPSKSEPPDQETLNWLLLVLNTLLAQLGVRRLYVHSVLKLSR